MSDWKTAWGKFRQQPSNQQEPQKQTAAGSQASKTVSRQDRAQSGRQRGAPSTSAGQIPPNPPRESAASRNIHSSVLTHSPQRTAQPSTPPPSRTIQVSPRQDQVTKHSQSNANALIARSPAVHVERQPLRHTSRKEPLPREPRGRKAPGINVGLDFGTSTTKVCVRQALGDAEDVHVYPVSLGGQQNFLCPSLVVLHGGRLYFGYEAAQRMNETGAVAFPHLKVCLACESEEGRQKPLSDCRSTCSASGHCEGIFPQAVRASELVTCFLAWVMGETRRCLPPAFGDATETRFTYNLGVPLDQLDHSSPLYDAYSRVSFLAWRLSEGMRQGVELNVSFR